MVYQQGLQYGAVFDCNTAEDVVLGTMGYNIIKKTVAFVVEAKI